MRCQCLDRGCIQDVLFRFGSLKTVLVINKSCSAHFLRSRRPLLLHLPTPSGPITPSQVWLLPRFCQVYRVTDEALIAETAVWPNFFLMNIFFALKGSKLFIIICCHCSWMLFRVAAVKSLPALIYSADYILLLVHCDHGIYSESSELIKRLDSFSKQI